MLLTHLKFKWLVLLQVIIKEPMLLLFWSSFILNMWVPRSLTWEKEHKVSPLGNFMDQACKLLRSFLFIFHCLEPGLMAILTLSMPGKCNKTVSRRKKKQVW